MRLFYHSSGLESEGGKARRLCMMHRGSVWERENRWCEDEKRRNRTESMTDADRRSSVAHEEEKIFPWIRRIIVVLTKHTQKYVSASIRVYVYTCNYTYFYVHIPT